MIIRVAYDVSVLINESGQTDRKSGIFRETEEIMYELNRRSDVDLTLVKLSDVDNFIFDSLKFSTSIKKEPKWAKIRTQDMLGSRFGLRYLQENLFDLICSDKWKKVPKSSVQGVLVRSIFKLLRELDSYQEFNYQKLDVYHSTYHKLPQEEVTQNLPRVLTIQDLIPVICPEFVVQGLRENFQLTLNSINKDKDWIICISEYTKQEFCDFTGMSTDRVFVTPLAAASHFCPVEDNLEIERVHKQYGIPEGKYFLSLASFLAPHKNLKYLINCFLKLISEHSQLDVNLVLAGSHRWQATAGEVIDEKYQQFSSRVVYTGYVADRDLSALYTGATAFIFPSLYEGFGLPPLEAMSCCTPVIASNRTSLPEVVGDAGILIDPKDEDDLCQSMLNLLKNDALVRELRYKGFERSKAFSWSRCTDETVKVYRVASSNR